MKPAIFNGYIALSCLMAGCADKTDPEETKSIGVVACQHQPAFLASTGLNVKTAALSTSQIKLRGLVVTEVAFNPADTSKKPTWQHPSWSKFGSMGPITIDEGGNAYVAPVPVINVLDNPKDKQNTIYKVDSRSAEIKPLASLPVSTEKNPGNPFGLLGLYYDCHGQKLYAATVDASTREDELGIIYLIDPNDGKIIDQLKGYDALGLCVGGISGTKRLYFGSSRTSDIYSVELTTAGKFSGKPQKEFSLDMLGARGDDKARRIRFDKNGNMNVFGVEFNYNLTAPTEKQETVYRFLYNDDVKKWELIR